MGVPVLRGGRVLGAMVVQNQALRSYTDAEMETLETTAMVLAELITGSGILDSEKARYDSVTEGLPQRIEGLALSPGMTVGRCGATPACDRRADVQ